MALPATRWARAAWARTRARSVLTPFNQAHEVPNLFVVDGSAFVTFPEKNPTLTIMALAVRASRHIVERRRTGLL